MNTEIKDPVMEKEAEEVVEVRKKRKLDEGEEEEEEGDEDDEEEGKKKVKFNPNLYDWTLSNGVPKSLA